MSGIVYAAIDGTVAHAGLRIKLNPGEAWDADDALVVSRPELFTDQPTHVRTVAGHMPVDIERAVTGPSERRTARAR